MALMDNFNEKNFRGHPIPSNQSNNNDQIKEKVCPYCGQSSNTVFVHGHHQCVICKTNVEPCCQGEVKEFY